MAVGLIAAPEFGVYRVRSAFGDSQDVLARGGSSLGDLVEAQVAMVGVSQREFAGADRGLASGAGHGVRTPGAARASLF